MSKELTKEETLNYLNNELEGILPNNKIREIAERLCQNTKPLIDEIYGLSAKIDYLTEENAKLKASKSEANEAVEFAEWILGSSYRLNPHCEDSRWRTLEQIHSSKPMLSNGITTTELYSIFKTRNNK